MSRKWTFGPDSYSYPSPRERFRDFKIRTWPQSLPLHPVMAPKRGLLARLIQEGFRPEGEGATRRLPESFSSTSAWEFGLGKDLLIPCFVICSRKSIPPCCDGQQGRKDQAAKGNWNNCYSGAKAIITGKLLKAPGMLSQFAILRTEEWALQSTGQEILLRQNKWES